MTCVAFFVRIFDLVASNHWVPFTFNFTLATNEHIVGATLAISMLAAGANASNDVLYLDSLTNGFSLASLGWLPISSAFSNPTVRVRDLSAQLDLLADGKLNVAVQNDVGIDWALLELQVAPYPAGGTGMFSLLPVADATVRGGTSANSNFGSSTTLTIKEDSSADFDRKAYLRWDLSSVTGTVYQAKVVTLCTNNNWTEARITWNNQPGGGKRFATWIPGTNAPLEFVITPQVLGALAGDKQLSLQLFSLRNYGGLGFVDYASREHTNVNSRPQLLLLATGSPPVVSPPSIGSISLSATNVVINGTGGQPGGAYYVLASTNLATPVANWSRLATSLFNAAGSFSFTNVLDPGQPQRFYLIQLP